MLITFHYDINKDIEIITMNDYGFFYETKEVMQTFFQIKSCKIMKTKLSSRFMIWGGGLINFFFVYKIFVLDCGFWMYGPNCSQKCGHCDVNITCDSSGLCTSGCQLGWKGSKCLEGGGFEVWTFILGIHLKTKFIFEYAY